MLVQSGWFFRKFAVFRFSQTKKNLAAVKITQTLNLGHNSYFFTQIQCTLDLVTVYLVTLDLVILDLVTLDLVTLEVATLDLVTLLLSNSHICLSSYL